MVERKSREEMEDDGEGGHYIGSVATADALVEQAMTAYSQAGDRYERCRCGEWWQRLHPCVGS